MTIPQFCLRFFAIGLAVSAFISFWAIFGTAIQRPEYAQYQGFDGLLLNAALGTLVALPLVISLGAIIGIPLDWLICRLNIATGVTFGGAGALASFGFLIVFGGEAELTFDEAALFLLAGLLSGLLWWLCIRRANLNGLINA